jgi:uncharacterized membrane protein YedE/YeeE
VNRRRRAWSAAAAGLLVVFVALPAFGFLWTLATGPTVGDAIRSAAGLAFSVLFGYWLIGGAVRRAQVR